MGWTAGLAWPIVAFCSQCCARLARPGSARWPHTSWRTLDLAQGAPSRPTTAPNPKAPSPPSACRPSSPISIAMHMLVRRLLHALRDYLLIRLVLAAGAPPPQPPQREVAAVRGQRRRRGHGWRQGCFRVNACEARQGQGQRQGSCDGRGRGLRMAQTVPRARGSTILGLAGCHGALVQTDGQDVGAYPRTLRGIARGPRRQGWRRRWGRRRRNRRPLPQGPLLRAVGDMRWRFVGGRPSERAHRHRTVARVPEAASRPGRRGEAPQACRAASRGGRAGG